MFRNLPALRTLILSILAIVLAPSVRGQQINPDATSTLPQVAEAFLGTWVGTSDTGEGGKVTSELQFQWTLGDNFLQVRNTVQGEGPQELYAMTLYGWQPVMGRLVFWAFDKDGTINEGMAELEAGILKHQWRSFSRNGEIRDWRSTLEKLDQNRIVFTVFDSRDTALYSIEYRRRKGQP